jgi:lipoic acid synthetase
LCKSTFIRDDLADGGSTHIAETIAAIKRRRPQILVECLAPDFAGNLDNAERWVYDR